MNSPDEAKPGQAAEQSPIDTVLMSGGAPNSPLMAGFLHALLEQGKMFSNYHTAGAGTLMALLALSPEDSSIARCEEPDPDQGRALRDREGKPLSEDAMKIRARGMKALKAWVDVGIADEIYDRFPVNFKLFHKPGPFAPVFGRLAERYKLDEADEQSDDPLKRLRDAWLGRVIDTPDRRRVYNELVDLAFAAVTPSTLSTKSKGLAAHLPFLESSVDFERLREEVPVHLCVNAFNMASGEMEEFHRAEIDARHIRAAFSMPFIYPPAQIGTDYYSEGAAHKPINFEPLIRERRRAWKRREQSLFERRERAKEEVARIERELAEARERFTHLHTGLASLHIAGQPTAQIESDIAEQGATMESLGKDLAARSEELHDIRARIHETIATRHPPHRVVLLDVMGSLSPYLVRPPRGLWDAYVISIMTPIVALAKSQIQYFKATQDLFESRHGYRHFELIEVSYDIPSYARPYVMDWSRSNLETLFNVGCETGRDFFRKYGADALVDIDEAWRPATAHDHAQ